MTISILDNIIDNLKTTCEGITIANGYYQDVKTVKSYSFKLPEQYDIDDFPVIHVVDSDELRESYDVDSTKDNLKVIIEGMIRRATDNEDLQKTRRKLQHDIEKALMVDEERDGNATFTKIQSTITDKGTMDPYTIFNMEFLIEFYYDRGDPASQTNSPL